MLFLLGILLLSTFLRFYHLDFQSLWMDEIHSVRGSDPARSLGSVIEYCRHDQPPAHFLMLHYSFKLLGYHELYGRILSVLMGIGGVAVLYFLGKELKDSQTGLIASFLTAINYFHIEYSQELRFYSLLFLAAALSYLFFIRAIRNERTGDFVGYSLATALVLYTHYYGLVVVASQGLIFLVLIALNYKGSKSFIIKAILAAMAVILLFLPWLPQIMQDNSADNFWIAPIHITFIIRYLFFYFGDDLFTTVICAGLIIAYLVVLCRSFRDLQTSEKISHVIVIGWVVYGYTIPYLYSILKMPMLFPRYTLITLPAVILSIAYGLETFKTIKWRMAVVLLISLISLIHLFFTSGYYFRSNKAQLREVAKEVADVNCTNCLILSDATWYYDFYFQKFKYYKEATPYNLLSPEKIAKVDSVWYMGAAGLLGVQSDPELITKNFHKAKDISGVASFARLYIRQDVDKVEKKDLARK